MKDRKRAILAVSFGTSFLESKEKTIDKIEKQMQETWPEYRVYRAWTSKMLIRLLSSRDGIVVDTVHEAMEKMRKDGARDIVVQPTYVINGIENGLLKENILKYKDSFEDIRFGAPLLATEMDYKLAVKSVMEAFPIFLEDEGLIWVGHGTGYGSNPAYETLEHVFRSMGYHNVFVGTVGACPAIGHILKKLEDTPIKKIHLAPFVIVNGYHANHDIAGDEEHSWVSILKKAGYQVECHRKGLGEFRGIREIYMKHLKEAIDA